ETMHAMVQDARVGVGASYDFKWARPGNALDLAISDAYGGAETLLRLYGTALRQADPLSEFLNYYRVIEAVAEQDTGERNGKKWVATNLASLDGHEFGRL